MQCILREKLLNQAFKLAEVSKIYRLESHRFVEAYFNWLEDAEKDLAGLRSPISILLQSEKSSLTSVLDGNLPQHVQEGKSIRKYQRVAASQSLERLSREIYAKIGSIDQNFDELREKLCHTIAVLASKEPDLYENLEASQQEVNKMWKKIASTPETIPMYNYFSAKLASLDINYLIMDIFEKIAGNKVNT